MAKPVVGDGFIATVLTSEFEEHGAHEGHLFVDGGAAENITRS